LKIDNGATTTTKCGAAKERGGGVVVGAWSGEEGELDRGVMCGWRCKKNLFV